VIEVTQQRDEYLDEAPEQFCFCGGCTWIVDTDSGQVRYAITKNVNSKPRLDRERRFRTEVASRSLRATYSRIDQQSREEEPFAVLHREF
jgi:hypothetical protein